MKRSLEILFLLFFVVWFSPAVLYAEEGGGYDKTATVKSDSSDVHSRMSENSNVVKRLVKGDVVEVDFEVEREGVNWCSAREAGQEKLLGYVRCAELDRKVRATQWKRVGPAGDTIAEESKRPYSDIKVLLYMAEW